MTLGVYAHFLEVSDREAAKALGLMITPPADEGENS
jgi:hypothetical protein